MRLWLVIIMIALSGVGHETVRADTTNYHTAEISTHESSENRPLSIPSPIYPNVLDTINIKMVVTLYVAGNGQLYIQIADQHIEAIPPFTTEYDYVANRLAETFRVNPDHYLRIVYHPFASAQSLVFLSEQINIFVKKRDAEENRIEYMRPVRWIEQWLQDSRYPQNTVDSIMMGRHHTRISNLYQVQSIPGKLLCLPRALSSDTVQLKDQTRVYIWKVDSVIIVSSHKAIVNWDGQEVPMKITHKAESSIKYLGAHINEARMRNPQAGFMLYVPHDLKMRQLVPMISELKASDVGIIYFAVIPREYSSLCYLPLSGEAVAIYSMIKSSKRLQLKRPRIG